MKIDNHNLKNILREEISKSKDSERAYKDYLNLQEMSLRKDISSNELASLNEQLTNYNKRFAAKIVVKDDGSRVRCIVDNITGYIVSK
jgi:hypothetical protein